MTEENGFSGRESGRPATRSNAAIAPRTDLGRGWTWTGAPPAQSLLMTPTPTPGTRLLRSRILHESAEPPRTRSGFSSMRRTASTGAPPGGTRRGLVGRRHRTARARAWALVLLGYTISVSICTIGLVFIPALLDHPRRAGEPAREWADGRSQTRRVPRHRAWRRAAARGRPRRPPRARAVRRRSAPSRSSARVLAEPDSAMGMLMTVARSSSSSSSSSSSFPAPSSPPARSKWSPPPPRWRRRATSPPSATSSSTGASDGSSSPKAAAAQR